MVDTQIINVDDINYAVYRIGEWENNYEINQVGMSREIPVTKPTLKHVKLSMEEIRMSKFDMGHNEVNGFIAIAMQLNPKIQDMEIDEMIELEEKEYQNILAELDALELLDDGETISLESEEYLIYKLQKEHHVTKSTPANEFTKQYSIEELKRITGALD